MHCMEGSYYPQPQNIRKNIAAATASVVASVLATNLRFCSYKVFNYNEKEFSKLVGGI